MQRTSLRYLSMEHVAKEACARGQGWPSVTRARARRQGTGPNFRFPFSPMTDPQTSSGTRLQGEAFMCAKNPTSSAGTHSSGRPASESDIIEVVAAALDGDGGAWRVLTKRYTPLVDSVSRRYRLPFSDTEDVGQVVRLRLFENLARLRDRGPCRGGSRRRPGTKPSVSLPPAGRLSRWTRAS